MPTELRDEMGNTIRERAQEYGATTGRPRRCGWFDAAVVRYTTQLNGFTSGALTRLDVLDILPTIKISTGYKLDGTYYAHPPSNLTLLERCEPVYEEMPGWQSPISHIRSFEELPSRAKAYVLRIQELIGCPIGLISVGPKREQTIMVSPFP